MKERKIEREWVDLTNLFCFLLPEHYCYKMSQSIMQCEKPQGRERVKMKDRKVRKRERERERKTLLPARALSGF